MSDVKPQNLNYVEDDFNGTPVRAWVKNVDIEEQAVNQLKNVASLPFIFKRGIAVMPDVHWGMGATVGSVIPTVGAIIPAAVGVDIGCGMIAVQTNINSSQLPDNLGEIRSAIEKAVPHGRTNNGGKGDRGAWGNTPYHSYHLMSESSKLLTADLSLILSKYPQLQQSADRYPLHLGTLGSGNHFIEICLDTEQSVWVMLHSGSRGIGNKIGTLFIELAKKEMKRWFINLPDADLAYLPEGSEYFNDYVKAVSWAQRFASVNREIMMEAVLKVLSDSLGFEVGKNRFAVNCHHNYVQKENHFGSNVWLTRKGAVSAREGELGIIPGSMGAKSYIVKGLGNVHSYNSCSHGAGRVMSRNQAKKTFTVEDHIKATQGVECRKDEDVIDETPGAYKDIDAVMASQSDLVEIIYELKQILCVKG